METCCYATGTSAQGHISVCVSTSMRGFANKAVLNMMKSDVLLYNCLIDSCLGVFTTFQKLPACCCNCDLKLLATYIVSSSCAEDLYSVPSGLNREEVKVLFHQSTLTACTCRLFGRKVHLVQSF